MNKRLFSYLLMASLVSISSYADDLSSLKAKAQQDQQVEATHNQTRVRLSAQEKAQLEAKKQQLLVQKQQLEKTNAALQIQFESNEKSLTQKETELKEAMSVFGDFYSTVKQAADDVSTSYQNSLLLNSELKTSNHWMSLTKTTPLPTMAQLYDLAAAMEEKIHTSQVISSLDIPFVQGNGQVVSTKTLRLGDMALVTDLGYVAWDHQRQQAHAYAALPSNAPRLSDLSNNTHAPILLDPSRGQQLSDLSQQPSLWDRISMAGGVGYVIILLLLVGLGIAIYRGIELWKIKQQVKQQLSDPQNPMDNPLGRILSVYDEESAQSIETIELRLLEATLDEQQGLERGLSMLKLLAALAPMLGLLGTVTGMIETFQVITQFGNGDPQIMAGGISMALMTTVLGLIAAMPLLLAHNLLSSSAEDIHAILEKQGVSLVARRAEQVQA